MPARQLVTKELSKFLGVLSHPHRIRIVEELRDGEHDVNFLEKALGISHARVSQHLALMRSNRLVVERRQGRRVFYRLIQPELAAWIMDGLVFLERDAMAMDDIRQAVQSVKAEWGSEQES